jgi:superfamily II DNA or RNA helicase
VSIPSDDQRWGSVFLRLEGRKRFSSQGVFSCEDTGHNRSILKDAFSLPISETLAGEDPSAYRSGIRMPYVQKTKAYAHQTKALDLMRPHKHFALFLEQGTGKTKCAIDRAGELFAEGSIDAVLVITKKGVHGQWVREQLPTHLSTPFYAHYWKKKRSPPLPVDLTAKGDTMKWFSINIDALNAKNGMDAAVRFCSAHRRKLLIIVDESQIIKNSKAKRSKACYDLAPYASHRLILTGTPVAKDLTDEWSQFKFLDESIIGIKYLTAFRNNYCIMGGFENRQVIGIKNLPDFRRRVDPYSFRVTKEEELDLPPKVFATYEFEMGDEQRAHYSELKTTYSTALESGEIISVSTAATLLMRLQQVTCGMLPSPDPEGEPIKIENARIDALMDLVEQRPGKTIIWARFRHDISEIEKALKASGRKCVTYFGGTKQAEREEGVSSFLDPNSGVDYFVSNPAAGGTGLNLQGECRTVIYYSNSFNSLDRWQSEDRTHRIGTTKTVTYFDLVCVGSPDRRILANLRNKKSVSDLALGEIKEMFKNDE